MDTKTNEVIGEPLIEWTDGKYGGKSTFSFVVPHLSLAWPHLSVLSEYDHVNTCPNAPPESEVGSHRVVKAFTPPHMLTPPLSSLDRPLST